MTLYKDYDKVNFLYNYLINYDNDNNYLIIVGKSGTGKTKTLMEAIRKAIEFYESVDYNYNFHIWNEGEKPGLINLNSANNLYIFIRLENDKFAKALQNEFDCKIVNFIPDPEI